MSRGNKAAGGYDLQQPKLRRLIEARLPKLGETLMAAGIPADQPLFALTKDQITDVFVAALCAGYEAGCNYELLNDEIPF